MWNAHSPRGVPAAIGFALMAGLAASTTAFGQTSDRAPQTPAATARADSAAGSAAAARPDTEPRRSRFGRFGHALRSAASTVQKKTGISGSTAARIAVTAATGGAATALLTSSGAPSAATAARQTAALAMLQARQSATAKVTPASLPSTASAPHSPVGFGNSTEATRAAQDLGQIAARASKGDPAAKNAIAALNTAMTAPDGEFAQLERQAQAGDPTVAQKIVIREDQIARAALASSHP